jgi:hypothetical protein
MVLGTLRICPRDNWRGHRTRISVSMHRSTAFRVRQKSLRCGSDNALRASCTTGGRRAGGRNCIVTGWITDANMLAREVTEVPRKHAISFIPSSFNESVFTYEHSLLISEFQESNCAHVAPLDLPILTQLSPSCTVYVLQL